MVKSFGDNTQFLLFSRDALCTVIAAKQEKKAPQTDDSNYWYLYGVPMVNPPHITHLQSIQSI